MSSALGIGPPAIMRTPNMNALLGGRAYWHRSLSIRGAWPSRVSLSVPAAFTCVTRRATSPSLRRMDDALRCAIEADLGARITTAVRAHGGDVALSYAVELEDGRRAFAKTHP